MLRNGETGDWIGTFEGHKGAVWSACLNTPATHAATASADFSARVWDAVSGEEVFNFAHKHIVRTVAFSQVRLVLRHTNAGAVSPAQQLFGAARVCRALTTRLGAVLLQQDSRRLLTGGHENLLRVYDLMAPDVEPVCWDGWGDKAKQPIRCARWHADDTLLLVACNDAPGVRVWDFRSRAWVHTLETAEPVTDVHVSGGLLCCAAGKQVHLWNAASFAPVATFTQEAAVFSADVCPSKGRLVTGGADMWPRLCDLRTGAELEVNKGHHGPVHCVRIHPGGDTFASGSEDGTIRLWSSVTAEAPASS